MLDVQPKSSFRIAAEDSKFFNKLLSKESLAANSSFRVSGSVPFTWESRPGTPKHVLSHTALPLPLAPPPSSYNRYRPNHRRQRKFEYPRSKNPFNAFLARIGSRRIKDITPALSSHSSSSSSSDSSIALKVAAEAPPLKHQGTSHRAPDSKFDRDADVGSTVDALCFRIIRGHRSGGCM